MSVQKRFSLLLALFLFIFISSLAFAEKTLCERKLAEMPPNVFYYQRTEAANAVECAERCVEDWEFCRSAALVQEKGKSLCQLYGISFERLLPLNLPQLTPAQTDPEQLLPITLVEVADPPCSSKFSANSQLLKSIGAATRETLALIPRPSAQKKVNREDAEATRKKANDDDAEEGRGGTDEDKPYLTPNPISKHAEEERQQKDRLPTDLFAPPTPIRPAFVSHGFGGPFWGRQRCRNGICSPRTGPNAAIGSFHSSQENVPCAARKSTDPCAPQAHWMEWTPGSCSVTCGNGMRQRRRYCSSGTQTDCPGDDTEMERCVMPACNQWTDWTEWSRCSASCGGGQRTRQRVCRNGHKCTGPTVDSRSCNEQICPAWTEWAEWGQCSASCGTGIQRRGRECVPKEGECAGLASEFRECELRACPSWSDWEPWSSCSKSCGGGESIRRRECQNGVADDCRGPAVEHLLCNTQPCASWSPWSEWSACSKSCGEGSIKTRTRECRYNGLPSDDCLGEEEEQAECRLGECPAWTEWTAWSECSTSCGHGRQTRSRQCTPNGYGCQGGDREVRFCQKAVCPYFDNWTEWGGCSVTCGRGFCERRRRCIKEGDLGAKRPAEERGEPLPAKEKGEEPENESVQEAEESGSGAGRTSVPEDITATDSLSSQTLEVAQSAATVAFKRRRAPLISRKLTLRDKVNDDEGGGGGGDCIGPEVERKPCDAGPCCEWSAWSAWSNCRVRCGNSGYRERSRSCESQQGYQGHSVGGRFGSFGGSSLFAPRYPFGGTQQCVVCVGEAHQTESCAIPEPGQHCDDEQPQSKNGKPYRDSSRSEFRARPKLRPETKEEREQRNTEDDYSDAGEKEPPPKVAMKDVGMKPKQDVSLDAEDCYWTEWSGWSVCDPQNLVRNRTRMCAGLRALAKDCQCQGPSLEQIACASHSTVEPSLLRTGPSSNSLLKRLQLTPRHKPSAAEKARTMEQKQQQTTVKREQPVIVKATECGEWKKWAEWGKCIGKCGTEGMRHRTRECRCSRGCAGIAKESVACQVPEC